MEEEEDKKMKEWRRGKRMEEEDKKMKEWRRGRGWRRRRIRR